MFDYSQVSSRDFEYIAREYLEDTFPGTWAVTSTSNDGNRDVVCTFSFADQTYEYWAEAKFTKSAKPEKLQKGQLDPTLVSAMLYPRQVSIKFITNNNIPDSYIYRLTDFRIKTNIGVTLVLKDEFEKWLQTKPELCLRYRITYSGHCTISETNNVQLLAGMMTEMIGSPSIVNKLVRGEPYYLYLIIDSDKPYDDISVKFNSPSFSFINSSTLYCNADKLSLLPGKNGYKFCFATNRIHVGDCELTLLRNGQILSTLSLPEIAILEPTCKEIAYAQQSRIEADIFSAIYKAGANNQVICVSGHAASGKTYLIDNLYKSLSFQYETIRLSFSQSTYYNCKQLCQLLMCLNIGNIEDFSFDAIELAVNSICSLEMRVLLLELISRIKDEPDRFIQSIYEKIVSTQAQLVFEQHSRRHHVFILEDVHKLDSEAKEVLGEILKQFAVMDSKQIIIYTSREAPIDKIKHSYSARMLGLTRTDKIASLKNYLGDLPNIIHFHRHTDNLLVFINIVRELLEKKRNYTIDPLTMKASVIRLCEHTPLYEKDIFIDHLAKYSKYDELIELVFYVELGIHYTKLSDFFSCDDIDFLIAECIFKMVSGKVLPFHDYYVEAYKENHMVSKKTVTILQKLMASDEEKSVLYLKVLLNAGNATFFAQLNSARSLRDYYFEKTMFYEAYLLAQAIVEKINFDEPLSEAEISDVFILATSSFYEKSSDEIVDLYNIVLAQGTQYKDIPKIRGIILRTRTELMNQYYWDLKTENLNQLLEEASSEFPCCAADDDAQVVFSCIHRRNRHMVFKLLENCYIEADEDYHHCTSEAARLNHSNSIGYAEMDYGKGLYVISLQDALIHMNEAAKVFEKTGTEYRRHLDCMCELAYLNCLINICTSSCIQELENAALALYRAHFRELYAKAKLKLAALYLCMDKPELIKAEEALIESEFVLPYRPCQRLQMLFANVKTAYYGLKYDHCHAATELEKHLSMASRLGDDYKAVANHNACIGMPICAKFYSGKLPGSNTLLIDPRIW